MDDHNSGAALLARAKGSWKLDPSTSKVALHTKAMWGLAKVNGTFKALAGSGDVGDDGALSGTFVVDAKSIDTKNKKRDNHLRSNDFFDTARHPTFTYTAAAARPSPDGKVVLTGDLVVKGKAQPVELVVTSADVTADRLTLTATAEVDRSRWGMNWAKMGAGMVNQLEVTAHFTRE